MLWRAVDFRDSAEEASFRTGMWEWIGANLPGELKGDGGEGEWGQLSSGHERHREAMAEWRGRLQSRGLVAPAWPKRFVSDMEQRVAAVALHLAGLFSQMASRSQNRWEPLMGRIGRFQLHSVAATIGGGTSEVQRNIISTRGLGLPRG
jgi:alkylation response protein AidB-like acyl-CoA dehydrogenase